jgi:non-ribosomal peptide synthetase-like protein
VIYTSGTTGLPKGVCISHLNAVTFVRAMMEVYGVDPKDRVLQGFSISFDASVEEIWMAFATGATLVVGSLETMRNVEELPVRLREYGITVLSTVPTLLAMMEPQEQPQLRLLLSGGEAIRADIIEKWASPGRKILNGYGPTECTVVATYTWCHPGDPVTIGKALPQYEVTVLNDDLREVPDGQQGELCVMGPGVSLRGYLNRPELNAEKFLMYKGKRLYRTGDLVYVDQHKDIVYCGRIDSQIKIRGFRVELEEIEMHLTRMDDCEGAIVALQEDATGHPHLVAYIIQSTETTFDVKRAIANLREKLPSYMIPSQFVSLSPAAIPTLTSGKINRKALPPPNACRNLGSLDNADITDNEELDEINCCSEQCKLLTIWRTVLQQPVKSTDSFFDLGGHSVLAAQAISLCRQDPDLASLGIRDLYECLNISNLTQRLQKRQSEASSLQTESVRNEKQALIEDNSKVKISTSQVKSSAIREQERVSESTYRFVVFLQTMTLISAAILSACVLCSTLYIIHHAWIWLTTVVPQWQWHLIAVAVVSMPILSFLALVGGGILLKRLLIGRYCEEDIPLWSLRYFRWWLNNLLLTPIRGLAGSLAGGPFAAVIYRWMGASIGKNVYIAINLAEEDLIEIGDGATISANAVLRTHYLEDGYLKLRRIKVGKDAHIGSQAILCGGTNVGDGCAIHPLSCLVQNTETPSHTQWRGSPAVQISDDACAMAKLLKRHEAESKPEDIWGTWQSKLYIFGLQTVYNFVFVLAFLIPFALEMLVIYLFFWEAFISLNLLVLLPSTILLSSIRFFSSLGILIGCKWLFTGKAKAGTIPLNSHEYVRRWFTTRLMGYLVSPHGLRGATETLLMPWICRALGMKVGKQVEISDCSGFQPDLVQLGFGAMLADRCVLGVPVVHSGRMTLDHVSISDRSFLANGAHLPITTPQIKEDCLVGVLSIAPDDMEASSSWLGSPPMLLPRRTKSFAPPHLTFNPPKHLYIARSFFNFWKMILPNALIEITFWCLLVVSISMFSWNIAIFMIVFPFLMLVSFVVMLSWPVIFKWLLIGKYKAGERFLWHNWMWRAEIAYEIELRMMADFSPFVSGTPFLTLWYRALGAHIGRRVCIINGSIMEADLTYIGDHVTLEGFLQTHLFEDRVMKLGKVTIRDNCTIGNEACVLYDSEMGTNSTLGDLSLIMKREIFLENRRYRGLPAENSL